MFFNPQSVLHWKVLGLPGQEEMPPAPSAAIPDPLPDTSATSPSPASELVAKQTPADDQSAVPKPDQDLAETEAHRVE